MYCPVCSTQATEGAKFCKSCGMNLAVVTQALNGELINDDPLRDREYKRARKQISESIQGIALGLAVLVVAVLIYIFLPTAAYFYATSLLLGLIGVVKLFRSLGGMIDAKMGEKFLNEQVQPRNTGRLSAGGAALPSGSLRPSQRLTPEAAKAPMLPAPGTRPVAMPESRPATPPARTGNLQPPAKPGTGRINREQSSPLRQFEKDDDPIARLRI